MQLLALIQEDVFGRQSSVKDSCSILDMFNPNQVEVFETRLILNFMKFLDRCLELKQKGLYQDRESRDTLIERVSKVLQLKVFDETVVDMEMMENLPVNSKNPLHLAADCLRDALHEFNILPEAKIEAARNIFICLRQNAFEVNRDRHLQLARQLSNFEFINQTIRSQSMEDLFGHDFNQSLKQKVGQMFLTPSAQLLPKDSDHQVRRVQSYAPGDTSRGNPFRKQKSWLLSSSEKSKQLAKKEKEDSPKEGGF